MPLPRHPLHGLSNTSQIWSWISFDVANQSFTLLINTMLFSIFFKEVVVRDPTRDDTLWSILFASSMLLVVIASPIAGAMADARDARKFGLIVTGVLCAILTGALALIPSGSSALWIAAAIYIPANFCFNLGENFLASFLPLLAPRKAMGRVSGFSWAIAYSAALFILILVAACMVTLHMKASETWRPFFVAAGVWFLLFMIPTALILKEPKNAQAARPALGRVVSAALAQLARTVREAGKFRDLAMLLTASLFYGAGMSVIVSFASILAKDFGFKDVDLVIFTAVITLSGVVGTFVPTFFQDKLGHKKLTLMLLLVWVATTLYIAFIARQHAALPPGTAAAKWPVWLAGNLLGFGLGSLGSANRAFVGYLTPKARSAEFFGLWGLVFKLAAVMVIPFGVVKDKLGLAASLLVLAAMVITGFVLTLFVQEARGARAAQESDADASSASAGAPVAN